MLEEEDIPKSYSREEVNKISSHIFVTLRYKDEDPIVEKPGAVRIAKYYTSITIISNQRKTYMY